MVKASQIPSLNRTQDTDSMLLAGKSVCLHTNGTKGVYIWMSLSPISLEKGFDFPPSPILYEPVLYHLSPWLATEAMECRHGFADSEIIFAAT